MGHVYYRTTLLRLPYIPAGCDQQQRVRGGARAELPRIGMGAVPLVAFAVGIAFWAQILTLLFL